MNKDFDMVEMIEHEMMLLWSDGESIPKLLKEDSEFVHIIVDGIMLERSFWKRHMVVGES
jgi:hypothetical protein